VEDGSILITGASGQVGRALVRRGIRPTVLVRKTVPIEGCTLIEDWLASGLARSAIARAQTIVHLVGALNPPDRDYERANVIPTLRLREAIRRDQARRLIFLSYVGASESSRNRYLSSKGQAERLLEETGVPVTIFRCTHIVGPRNAPGPTAASFLASAGGTVTVIGNGRQRVAPLYIGDVVTAIEEAIVTERNGIFDLQGPDEMSVDEFVRVLNRRSKVRIVHVPAAVAFLLRFVGPRLPAALIDVMIHDSVSSHPTAAAVFGLSLRQLDRVWAAE